MKNPFKRDHQEKTNPSKPIYLVFIIAVLLGIFLYIITNKIILFVLSMAFCLTSYMIFSSEIENENQKKNKNLEILLNIEFFENFYLYSSLNNSYWEGFKCAFDNLKLSHLKDKLQDYLDNPDSTLEIQCSNSRIENLLLDMLIKFLHSNEETNENDLNQFHLLLLSYKKENETDKNKIPLYFISVLICVIIVLIITFCLLKRGK